MTPTFIRTYAILVEGVEAMVAPPSWKGGGGSLEGAVHSLPHHYDIQLY